MDRLTLGITVISADVIKHVTLFAKTRAYAAVSLVGATGSLRRQMTTVDFYGGDRPIWNFPMSFEIEGSMLRQNSLMLVFQLRSRRTFRDKDIGLLYVPVKEIFDLAGGTSLRQEVALPVSSNSGKAKGVLYLSYAFSGGTVAPPPSAPVDWGATSCPSTPIPSAPYMESMRREETYHYGGIPTVPYEI